MIHPHHNPAWFYTSYLLSSSVLSVTCVKSLSRRSWVNERRLTDTDVPQKNLMHVALTAAVLIIIEINWTVTASELCRGSAHCRHLTARLWTVANFDGLNRHRTRKIFHKCYLSLKIATVLSLMLIIFKGPRRITREVQISIVHNLHSGSIIITSRYTSAQQLQS